jgi:hypothetical protein
MGSSGETVQIDHLIRVLGQVAPLEIDRRALPGSDSEFSTRLETGIDCDFVFKDSILVGNL